MNYFKKVFYNFAGWPESEEELYKQKILTLAKKSSIQMKINSLEREIQKMSTEITSLSLMLNEKDQIHIRARIRILARPLLNMQTKCRHYYSIMNQLSDSENRLESIETKALLVSNMGASINMSEDVYGSTAKITRLAARNEAMKCKDEIFTDTLDLERNDDISEEDLDTFLNSIYVQYNIPTVLISGVVRDIPNPNANVNNNQSRGGGGENGDGGGEAMLNIPPPV